MTQGRTRTPQMIDGTRLTSKCLLRKDDRFNR
jgi:hypothetical protein